MEERCTHGGRFHERLGRRFEDLDQLSEIIPADVLDAWFPPAPGVLEALREHLSLLTRTSPPVGCEPMEAALAEAFGVERESVLAGPGSSALIYLAFRPWLHPGGSIWVADPGYAEYRHMALLQGAVFGGEPQWPGDGVEAIRRGLRSGPDALVIINPNNPTGWAVPTEQLEGVLEEHQGQTLVWVDEAYRAYCPVGSLAGYAATHRGVFVSRSLSKSHALSGLRAACLIGHPDRIRELRSAAPPWWVSFPAQLGVIEALKDKAYYGRCYKETEELRGTLTLELRDLGLKVLASAANWVLVQHPMAREVIETAAGQGVYLRDPSNMKCGGWRDAIRVAVRSTPENRRVVETLRGLV